MTKRQGRSPDDSNLWSKTPGATRTSVDLGQRLRDVLVAGASIIFLLPVSALAALAIKLESRGPVFYRCRRVGLGGREFSMLKFRKMRTGAAGGPLTAIDDERFTRIGRFLAKTKLDEIPQLWNVLTGSMSLVGPRPEDPVFVERQRAVFEQVLRVRPGITGLSQLAFAREMEILDPDDRIGDYVRRLLPQKVRLDQLYVQQRSSLVDLRILWWTLVAVVGKRDVAVDRATGRLSDRRRPSLSRSQAGQMEKAVL